MKLMTTPFNFLVLVVGLIVAGIMLCWHIDANAATSCDDWANFTKIVTYRWRGPDSQDPHSAAEVKAELERVKVGDPEMAYALKWIDFTYAHPELSPVDVWKAVYKQCNTEGSI